MSGTASTPTSSLPVAEASAPVEASRRERDPPTASFTYLPSSPVTGQPVTFDATSSTCPVGPCTYEWSDDGSTTRPIPPLWVLGSGQILSFTFSEATTKYVRLVVTDASGQTATVEHNVVVSTPVSLQRAPANTVLPAISGTTTEGQTLSAGAGTWSNSPTSYAYQWQDCNTAGEACSAISAATASSYKLAAGDVGHTIRVVVTATNAVGSTLASSPATGVVVANPPASPSAPTNTVLPAINGTTTEGQTLSAGAGTWSGSPTSYAYQWQDCNTAGEACSAISGATASSYKLAAGDVGHTIRVVVTAANAAGSTLASSPATGVVVANPPTASFTYLPSSPVTGQPVTFDATSSTCPDGACTYEWSDDGSTTRPIPPLWVLGSGQILSFTFSEATTKYVRLVVTDASGQTATVEHNVAVAAPVSLQRAPTSTALPAISGTTTEGQTVSAGAGTWSGSPTSYAYQWQDCNTAGEACSAISGATASSYKLAAGDVGHTIRVVVTAANAAGSTLASSPATGVVVANPPASPSAPTNTALPAINGTITEGQTLSAGAGTWSNSPTSYAYQWEDCNTAGEACSAISAATASSYKLAAGDVGHRLRVVVTATNAAGSTLASSPATGVVVASPPTPSGRQTNCFSAPSSCGYPDPSNTGVPAGTSLTSETGEKTITTNGTVYKDKKLKGNINIEANNVTVEDNEIEGTENGVGLVKVESGFSGTRVAHDTIHGETEEPGAEFCVKNYGGPTTTVEYVNCYHAGLGWGPGLWENDYCFESFVKAGEHYECLYWGGYETVDWSAVVRHDTLINPWPQTADVFLAKDGGNEATGQKIENNLLEGGGYAIYGGESGQEKYKGAPITVTGNRFTRCLEKEVIVEPGGNHRCEDYTGGKGEHDGHGYFPNGGNYGISAYMPSGSVWSGNYWDDSLEEVK